MNTALAQSGAGERWDVRPWLESSVGASIGIMLSVLAQMMDRGDMHGGDSRWSGWLIGLAALALIVGLVVWAVLRITHTHAAAGASPPAATSRSSAEDLLADRLARGDIDPGEYRERLSALRER